MMRAFAFESHPLVSLKSFPIGYPLLHLKQCCNRKRFSGSSKSALNRFYRTQATNDEEEISIPIINKSGLPSGETVAEKLERLHRNTELAKELKKSVPKNLMTSNWEGDVYTGSQWNVLTVLLIISILVPLLGLVFAYFTYGVLWGLDTQAL